jgi:hypothetical protein
MASTLEIKYFNSFWLKKMVSVVNTSSIGNGGDPSPPYYSLAIAPGDTIITVNGDAPNVFVGQVVSYTVGTAPTTTKPPTGPTPPSRGATVSMRS